MFILLTQKENIQVLLVIPPNYTVAFSVNSNTMEIYLFIYFYISLKKLFVSGSTQLSKNSDAPVGDTSLIWCVSR